MSISDLRFGSVQALRSATKNVPLARYTRARDKKGYYITDYELDPIMQELFNEMRAAVKKTSATSPTPPAPVLKAPAPSLPPAPPKPPSEGPVHRIREWMKAHPKATKEDALEHFPDLNPGTVRVQFRKIRNASK